MATRRITGGWRVRAGAWAGIMAMLASAFSLGVNGAESVSAEAVAELARQLEDPSKEVRRKAAYALGELGEDAVGALDALIEAMGDDDDQVWYQSVMTLANLGPQAAPAIDPLLEAMEGGRRRNDEQRTLRTAFALGNIGEAAIEPLRTYLRSDSTESGRLGAAKALGWMGERAVAAMPEVLDLLDDDAAEVRREATETLVRFGESSVPEFVSRLSDPNAAVREEAVYGLGRCRPQSDSIRGALLAAYRKETDLGTIEELLRTMVPLGVDPELMTPILVQELLAEEASVVDVSLDAMMAMDDAGEDLVPTLAALLQSKDRKARLRSLRAIELLGESAASSAGTIIRALQHRALEEEESQACLRALVAIGPPAVQTLLSALESVSVDQLSEDHWSIELVGELVLRVQSVLEAQVDTESPAVRYLLLRTLNRLPRIPPAARRLAMRSLDDSHRQVRASAVAFLPELDLRATALARRVRLAADDEAAEVRRAAVSVAANLRDQTASLALLQDALEDEDPGVKLEAVVQLRALKDRAVPALPNLIEKLQTGSGSLQLEVIRTIAAMEEDALPVVPVLVNLLAMADSALKRECFLCLTAIGKDASDALTHVEQGLDDSDDSVRAAALRAYGRLESSEEKQLPVFLTKLEDSSDTVQELAVKALGDLGKRAEPAAPQLLAMLDDAKEPRLILEALRTIPYGKPDLYLRALEHSDPAVRLFACDRLGKLGKAAEEALPALRKAEEDSYRFVARRAREARRLIEGRDGRRDDES